MSGHRDEVAVDCGSALSPMTDARTGGPTCPAGEYLWGHLGGFGGVMIGSALIAAALAVVVVHRRRVRRAGLRA